MSTGIDYTIGGKYTPLTETQVRNRSWMHTQTQMIPSRSTALYYFENGRDFDIYRYGVPVRAENPSKPSGAYTSSTTYESPNRLIRRLQTSEAATDNDIAWQCLQTEGCVAFDSGGNLYNSFYDYGYPVTSPAKDAATAARDNAYLAQIKANQCRGSDCKFYHLTGVGASVPYALFFSSQNYGGNVTKVSVGNSTAYTVLTSVAGGVSGTILALTGMADRSYAGRSYGMHYCKIGSAIIPPGCVVYMGYSDGSKETAHDLVPSDKTIYWSGNIPNFDVVCGGLKVGTTQAYGPISAIYAFVVSDRYALSLPYR